MRLLRIFDPAGNIRCEIPVDFNGKLSETIWLSGKLPEKSLCAGVGLCGRCKVRFLNSAPEATEKEKRFFPQKDVSHGWRLACQHDTLEPFPEIVDLELPETNWENSQSNFSPPQNDSLIRAALGIDLGTTSIAWKVTSQFHDEGLPSGITRNPQCAAGADVISRILAAQSAKGALLRKLVLDWLLKLLEGLKTGGIEIERICVAANSAMTGIMREEDLTGLAKSPYFLSFRGGDELRLPEISPPLLFPPLVSPFIGGDITAGLLAILEQKPEKPFLLVDLGTNGELALFADAEKVFFASVPMGPAMEGIGPAQGSQPGPGVATYFRLYPTGLKPHDQNGVQLENAQGISATGYLSLLAGLKRLRLLAPSGAFACKKTSRWGITSQISLLNGKDGLDVGNGVKLTREDVEMLLMVKAAFSVALQFLLDAAGLSAGDVKTVYMAGALGQFANYADLLSLGFMPPGFADKITGIGNSSLAGACILAKEPGKIKELIQICAGAKVLNLADDIRFQEKYPGAMEWRWLE